MRVLARSMLMMTAAVVAAMPGALADDSDAAARSFLVGDARIDVVARDFASPRSEAPVARPAIGLRF